MTLFAYVAEAFSALFSNKLRTVLALVGLIVGVSAVIAIQILGHATSGAVAGIIQGFSSDTFLVFPDNNGGFDIKQGLDRPQLEQIKSIPNVADAIAFDQRQLQFSLEHQKAQLTVAPAGSDPGFLAQPIAEGRAFTADDVASSARVCILSATAASKLSPDGNDTLGKALAGGPLRCTIVGVLAKPPSGAANFSFAPDIIAPATLFTRTFDAGSSKIYQIQVLVSDQGKIGTTEGAVKEYLTALSLGKYKWRTFDSLFFNNLLDSVFGVLTAIVAFVAAISLVVAGIGIMNILLVSIVERTREIGIRKAIGARRAQIMLQFFFEAFALTAVGCALGTGIGIALGAWVNSTYLVKISGVTVPIQWGWSVVLAIVFVTIVTLVFGLYPAYRAARLDPIEALRYE